MNRRDGLKSLLHQLLAEEFTECIEDDAIADTKEKMKRGRHDALWVDGEERRVIAVEGVAIASSAVARGGEEALVRDDADGTGMSGGWSHEAKNRVDERPVAVEESPASVDDMLQHGKDVTKGGRVTGEGSEGGLLQ